MGAGLLKVNIARDFSLWEVKLHRKSLVNQKDEDVG